MAAKKKEVYEFSAESCINCKFFDEYEGNGYCIAMPPHKETDDSGESWYTRGMPCDPEDRGCVHFKQRLNS